MSGKMKNRDHINTLIDQNDMHKKLLHPLSQRTIYYSISEDRVIVLFGLFELDSNGKAERSVLAVYDHTQKTLYYDRDLCFDVYPMIDDVLRLYDYDIVSAIKREI